MNKIKIYEGQCLCVYRGTPTRLRAIATTLKGLLDQFDPWGSDFAGLSFKCHTGTWDEYLERAAQLAGEESSEEGYDCR